MESREFVDAKLERWIDRSVAHGIVDPVQWLKNLVATEPALRLRLRSAMNEEIRQGEYHHDGGFS